MDPERTSSAPEYSSSSHEASSSSSYPVRHEEEEAAVERRENDRTSQEHSNVSRNVEYLTTTTTMTYDETRGAMREDTWSCIVVLITFWFFVAMTLILGVFGASNLQLTPNSSILIKPNLWFVDHIKVEQINEADSGPVLYGLYSTPPLDVVKLSSENHTAIILTSTYKEWMYILNEGSQINISYSVTSPSSLSLILIVSNGSESLEEWIADPSYPNNTLSWNVIKGNGFIQQSITGTSTYYVAVGNLNSEDVQVNVNISVKSYLYNTSEAYYKCAVSRRSCSLKLLFPGGNSAVLTSQSVGGNDWYVKLSYGPRWITYGVGIGGLSFVMFVAFHYLNNFQSRSPDGRVQDQRAPLLARKDSDLSSWGSSYDSVSDNDEEHEEPVKDGEYSNNNVRRLCASCFDAPRDCFFLPCGHCVACFTCGSRITEVAGTCPICRRNIKKVRKIFTV